MKRKRQHYVPQSYLKAWCDSETPKGQTPYVWVFPKDGEHVHRRAPQNLFVETDFYTIRSASGERDLILEEGLSQLESEFARVREIKIIRRKPLLYDDRVIVCAFIAATRARTKANRQRMRELWQQVLTKMDLMAEWAKTTTEEQLEAASATLRPPSRNEEAYLTYEEVKQIVEQPIQSFLADSINVETPLLLKLDMVVIETSTSPGFITSDDPCVWYDPQSYTRPPPLRGPALMYPSIEISFPVSPNFMLLLNRQGTNGQIRLAKYGTAIDQEVVDRANWRTRIHAHEHFVVNSKVKRESWFTGKSS